MNLFNHLTFNYVIMSLYGANILVQLYHNKWADASYWLCALGITATVTFGYQK